MLSAFPTRHSMAAVTTTGTMPATSMTVAAKLRRSPITAVRAPALNRHISVASTRRPSGAQRPARYTARAPRVAVSSAMAVSEPPNAAAVIRNGSGLTQHTANNHSCHIRTTYRTPNMIAKRHAVHSTTPNKFKCHSTASVGIRLCNRWIPVKPTTPTMMATIQSDSPSLTPLGACRYPVAMTPIRMGTTSRRTAREPASTSPTTSAITNA